MKSTTLATMLSMMFGTSSVYQVPEPIETVQLQSYNAAGEMTERPRKQMYYASDVTSGNMQTYPFKGNQPLKYMMDTRDKKSDNMVARKQSVPMTLKKVAFKKPKAEEIALPEIMPDAAQEIEAVEGISVVIDEPILPSAPEPIQVTVSAKDRACKIKGNITDGKKRFYPENCSSYSRVKIDESKGETWFCSFEEAEAADFLIANSCQ